MGTASEQVPRRALLFFALPFSIATLQSVPFVSFLPAFYSTDLGLPLALVGLAISVTRLSDIFTDIILGSVSDRLRTRWGRRKPMIAAGIPMAAAAAWMLFVPGERVGVLYLFAWVIFFNIATSTLEVPLTAMGAEMSRDYHQRSRVTAWRAVAGAIGSLVALSIPLILQTLGQGETRDSLFWFTICYVLLLPLSYLPLLLKVPEAEPRDAPGEAPRFWQSFAILWKNQAFRVLALGLFLFVGGKAVSQALNLIVITELVDARELFPTMLVLENLCGLAGVPAWLWLARRSGKHVAMLGAALWSGVWSIPLFFMGPDDGWLFVFIIAMRAVSLTAWLVLIPSMTADAVDVDTLESGRERTGMFFGALGFAGKAAGALGILIGTTLPALAGFQPSDAAHSDQALFALRFVYAILGPLLVIAAAFCFGRFPITQAKQRELRAAIDARVAGREGAAAPV